MPYRTEPTLADVGTLRVLVVDDDLFINRLVQLRLNRRGYEVASARDGQEALTAIQHSPPDLIFLDVSMPEVDGLSVLEAIRRERLDIAVVMMTAYGSESVAVEAMRQGADDYLPKPFDATDFDGVLERVVRRLLLTRQNALLRRRLEQEMADAASVQADLLPARLPTLPNFEVAAYFRPARAVSGDFYDWTQDADGSLALTLGDVMGKGMPAALLMAMVRAVMRVAGELHAPAKALATAHHVLGPDLDRSGRFITLFHALLEPDIRRVIYADAGHGLGVIRRADGCVELLHSHGLPLGVLPDVIYAEQELTFAPGDCLVVYSDGLTDAGGDLFTGPMLAATLDGDMNAAEIIAALMAAAVPPGDVPDDLTVLVLRCIA